MSQETNEPPRGEAAWRAAKQRIQQANEAAYARGREERAADAAEAAGRRRSAERQAARTFRSSRTRTDREPMTVTDRDELERLEAEAKHHRNRLALYRQRSYSGKADTRGCAICSGRPTPRTPASRPRAPGRSSRGSQPPLRRRADDGRHERPHPPHTTERPAPPRGHHRRRGRPRRARPRHARGRGGARDDPAVRPHGGKLRPLARDDRGPVLDR